MTSQHPVTHLLILENDAAVARAVGALALEVLAHEPQILLGSARTAQGALELVERLRSRPADRILVACAARLADDSSGLAILDVVEKRCPNARVILLTDGEREDLAQGLSARVDGIVQKPLALPELRAILAHLASDATRTGAWQARAKEGASGEVRLALRALDAALEAVEEAHEALRAADAQAAPALRQHLAEAERLALLAHRRVLEVERALSP